MPNYCQHKLEFSRDPLSDSTPTWIDISVFLIEANWSSGKAKDLDEPQAGGATFLLKNTNRRFEPAYAAGAYYPDIVPLRRFRWTIIADGVTYPQGIYYTQSWQVSYPNPGSTYSEVSVSCVDGFAILAKNPLLALDPPTASTYEDVITADNPLAYFPLAEEAGGTIEAAIGPPGSYKGAIQHVRPNPVVGDAGFAALIPANSGVYGRAKLDDVTVFNDAGTFTVEGVAILSGTTHGIAAGPWRTTDSEGIFTLNTTSGASGTRIRAGGTSNSFSGTPPSTGTHHYALVYDGSAGYWYIDGALFGSIPINGALGIPDANDFLYIGDAHAGLSGVDIVISHVAFYDYPLGAAQVASHAAAALNRGYASQLAGDRIASLAANPLWSTAGIPAGQITVRPEMQTGQATLDELLETVKAETPIGLFYFNDSGDPAYQPFEYTTTVQATFGEAEVQYDDLGLQYDDEVYNQSTVSREGGLAQTAGDTTSQGQYGTRAHDETGLIIQNDSDARLISQALVDRFATPMYRIETITLNGAAQNRRTQILTREIGDTIRVKRRGEGGTANPDVITRILGKQKHLDVNKHLTCTWNLARGFPAQDAHWRLGQVGYGELGQTSVLA